MNRHGLLIGNTEFPFYPELSQLITPLNDIKGLEDALTDQSRGKFALESIKNGTSQEIKDGIEALLKTAASDRDSLALIYYSGHGLLDPTNRLYLAASDTHSGRFGRTVPISDIVTGLRIYRPKRVVIVLDCCYSGAGGTDIELKGMNESLEQLSKGEGVVMMTACSPVEQAAGNKITGYGIFTKHLVDGIKTGEAAKRQRGQITVQDLFEYVSLKMKEENAPQTPSLWNLQQIGASLVVSEVQLKGTNSAPIDPKLRWVVLNNERRPILDLVGPSYILDNVFHFMDWNTAFDFLVARPLRLRRGVHVQKFLEKLRNWQDVRTRSNQRFVPGHDPLVDIETLEFLSNDYGLVVFEKIAGQILGDNGQVKAWCVNLNISSVAKKSELWAKMAENLGRDLNWSRYAKTYDRVISEFSEYKKLLDLVVKKVGPAPRVADLGCGTGNVTIRLLEDDIYRTVLAIDKNESMLDALQRKLDASSDENRLKERATLYKGGITNCLREQGGGSFDACVMLNVLFALDNPAEALAEVYRVLSPNGVLALSTSHHETNISALFKSIQQNLVDQGKWSDAIEVAWMDAYQRNSAMEAMITRDSKDDIQNYITTAGFRIDEYHEDEYVNCVVVIKAVKVG